jgi:hypothetical protein
VREVHLFGGRVAQVDDADFAEVDRFRWYGTDNGGPVHAYRHVSGWSELELAPHTPVVFRDGNTLNCQRSNLVRR